MKGGALDLLAFAGVMALGQFSPGPDMILLTRNSLKCGARVGVVMALGIACGLAVHSTVAVLGFALFLEKFPGLRQAMHGAAALYLLWLALGLLRGMGASDIQKLVVAGDGGGRRQGPFLRGLYCNLSNPKAAIFLAAVCSPFLKGERPGWWPLAIWGIIVAQGFLLWSLWAAVLQWSPLRRTYQRLECWIDGAFAILLVALACHLVFGELEQVASSVRSLSEAGKSIVFRSLMLAEVAVAHVHRADVVGQRP